MLRKILWLLLVLLLLALFSFALYGLWVAWQQELAAALRSGLVTADTVGRRLLWSQTRLLVGLAAAFFLLLTVCLIGLIAWLVSIPESTSQSVLVEEDWDEVEQG